MLNSGSKGIKRSYAPTHPADCRAFMPGNQRRFPGRRALVVRILHLIPCRIGRRTAGIDPLVTFKIVQRRVVSARKRP